MRFRKAFTLVELLVVVSIIALLLAILLPAMGRAKEVARRTVCMSSQRQQVLAYSTFANEHKGNVPLQYGTAQRRNSAYFYESSEGMYHNFANLWRADLIDQEAALVCPSYEPRAGGIAIKYLGEDYSWVDEFDDLPTLTMFNARPMKRVQLLSGETAPNEIDDFLVPLADHARQAIVSERLYAHWGRAGSFHKNEGLVAGYGDGHIEFVADKNGSKFANVLASNRANTNYYVDSDGDGELEGGVWHILDRGH